jgi:hypothetical protein
VKSCEYGTTNRPIPSTRQKFELKLIDHRRKKRTSLVVLKEDLVDGDGAFRKI